MYVPLKTTPQEEPRFIRPSERFANTGIFGSQGIYGQGGSLNPSRRANATLDIAVTPVSQPSGSTAEVVGTPRQRRTSLPSSAAPSSIPSSSVQRISQKTALHDVHDVPATPSRRGIFAFGSKSKATKARQAADKKQQNKHSHRRSMSVDDSRLLTEVSPQYRIKDERRPKPAVSDVDSSFHSEASDADWTVLNRSDGSISGSSQNKAPVTPSKFGTLARLPMFSVFKGSVQSEVASMSTPPQTPVKETDAKSKSSTVTVSVASSPNTPARNGNVPLKAVQMTQTPELGQRQYRSTYSPPSPQNTRAHALLATPPASRSKSRSPSPNVPQTPQRDHGVPSLTAATSSTSPPRTPTAPARPSPPVDSRATLFSPPRTARPVQAGADVFLKAAMAQTVIRAQHRQSGMPNLSNIRTQPGHPSSVRHSPIPSPFDHLLADPNQNRSRSPNRQVSPPQQVAQRSVYNASTDTTQSPDHAGLGRRRDDSTLAVTNAAHVAAIRPVSHAETVTSDDYGTSPTDTIPPRSPRIPQRAEQVYTGKTRFIDAICSYPYGILATLLDFLDYDTFRSLYCVSNKVRSTVKEGNAKRIVLERYLGAIGYREHRDSALDISLQDLHACQASKYYSLSEYALLAAEHKRRPLELTTLRMLRASSRAYSKLVARLRLQPPDLPISRATWATPSGQASMYKIGRAASFRVWIPCESQWMTDAELMECERELHRSGVWQLLKKGDLVRNIAVGDIANEGVVIFDGKYLRDLAYTHDAVGHLPAWLDVLAWSPSYWHNLLASSTDQPVVFMDITPFLSTLQNNMSLCKDRIAVESPSGDRHLVNRFVYRATISIKRGMSLGIDDEQMEGGGVIHHEWIGQVIIEVDGTSEATKALLDRATRKVTPASGLKSVSLNSYPYKLMRAASRPGQIWVKPVEVATSRQTRRM